MVSYKKLYEDLKKEVEQGNKDHESDYLCPHCNKVLMETPYSEIYCNDDKCNFDYTPDEIIFVWAENRNLERRKD